MFKRKSLATVVKRQGEKIIELERKNEALENKNFNLARENLNLTGMIDDIQEEKLFILDNVENELTVNSYNNNAIKISRTLEYVREQKDVIEKELDKNNELASNNSIED